MRRTASEIPADSRQKLHTEEQINAAIEQGYKTGKFQAPRKPGIVYMMSDHIYLLISGNQMLHYPPHLMFYAPYATDKDIVSPPPTAGMPHLIRAGRPDAVIIVVHGKKQVISFAKLNLMLSSDCSQIGTGSSNSPCSAKQSVHFAYILEIDPPTRQAEGLHSTKY